jgi:hypothetical protein
VGAVSGPLSAPRTLLLARYDTTDISGTSGGAQSCPARRHEVLRAGWRCPPGPHPWKGRTARENDSA